MKRHESDLDIALSAIARLLTPHIARELAKMPRDVAERPFSQLDGERPAGITKIMFLRAWRAAMKHNHPGATRDGRARLLTEEAFKFGRSIVRPPKKVVVEQHDDGLDDRILRKLGLSRIPGVHVDLSPRSRSEKRK